MKIEYRKPAAAGGGSGGYTVIADDASASLGDRISAYKPSYSSSPSVTPLFMSGKVDVRDLGNGQWKLSFSVHRAHASAAAALIFLATHAAEFDATALLAAGKLGNMDLRVSVGSQFVYMASAAIVGFDPDAHSDQSTFCTYQFVGGSYSTTAP